MLKLGRRPGQRIFINGSRENGGIEIEVLSMGRGGVEIGIVAPKSISVDREELWYKKQAEQRRGDDW